MGLFSDAAAMARGRAGAILLTSALALVPAYFLAGGIAFLASNAGERMDLSTAAGYHNLHGSFPSASANVRM